MFRRNIFLLCVIFLLTFLVQDSFACRFWISVSRKVANDFTQQQLLTEPYSLKILGSEYKDGWSVGFYEKNEAVILRGSKRADLDKQFDAAVQSVAKKESPVVYGHLRRASSGCIKDVPNPHPFERFLNGKNWVFGHNGGISKDILNKLIGEEHLNENPPLICTDNPPDSWIDSELFFIYLLKKIEQNNWNVTRGLKSGLEELYSVIDDEKRYLNLFLSDGRNVWAFRKGASLYYIYDVEKGTSSISSTVPTKIRGEWRTFPEDTIALLRANKPVHFVFLSDDVINKNLSDEEYILKEFQKARVNKYKTENLIRYIYRKYIKGKETPTGFIAIHYAALMGLRAKYVFDPLRKSIFLKQSVNLLDKAVRDYHNDLSVHFMRYVTLNRMPSFLYGIAGKRNEDVPIICELLLKGDYSVINEEKQLEMAQLMIERAPLSLKHRIGLERLVKQLSKQDESEF